MHQEIESNEITKQEKGKKSFTIIVNSVSRTILVEYEENKLSFPLKKNETIDTFTEILTREQKTNSGMTFSIDRYRVTIRLPKDKIKELTDVSKVRGYLTEIRIPVKGFVRHDFYK